jgi:hypothetical protein
MKLAIMQPYFFPYIGYFSLIKSADKWIVFDSVQFIRHGWIERNRILKPDEGWQYIKVPLLKHSRETLIKDVRINNHEDWKKRLFRQLEHYRKKALYYNDVVLFLEDALNIATDSIVSLNTHLLSRVCSYLDIRFNHEIFSEMAMEINQVDHPGDWALHISKALGASKYINPGGGKNLFDKNKFHESSIDLKILKTNLQEYSQNRTAFESGLSIIDVMMFNSKEAIHQMLDQYELI